MSQAGSIGGGGSGGGGVLDTLSDNVGTLIYPDSMHNIQLVGYVPEQGSTEFSTVVAGSHIANINPMSTERWIVDPLGFNGTHTTLAAAIAAATAGDTIFIVAGSTLTENVTLKAGVNIVSDTANAFDQSTTIVGKCTFTGAGSVSISGITFQTNSDYFLAVTGSAASIVTLTNCYLNCLNNTGIDFTSSSSSASVNAFYSKGNIGTTGIGLFASSSAGSINILHSDFKNSGNSVTSSTISAGSLYVRNSTISSPITTSGTAQIQCYSANLILPDSGSTTALTHNGTANSSIFSGGYIYSDSSTSVSVGVGADLHLYNTAIFSSATDAITGAGTVHFAGLTFISTSSVDNATTQIPLFQSNNAYVVSVPGSYPYTVNAQDQVIPVDTSTTANTITLEASPVSGIKHTICDIGANAATHNITISGNGNNIVGTTSASSYVLNTNGASVDVQWLGTVWKIV